MCACRVLTVPTYFLALSPGNLQGPRLTCATAAWTRQSVKSAPRRETFRMATRPSGTVASIPPPTYARFSTGWGFRIRRSWPYLARTPSAGERGGGQGGCSCCVTAYAGCGAALEHGVRKEFDYCWASHVAMNHRAATTTVHFGADCEASVTAAPPHDVLYPRPPLTAPPSVGTLLIVDTTVLHVSLLRLVRQSWNAPPPVVGKTTRRAFKERSGTTEHGSGDKGSSKFTCPAFIARHDGKSGT